MRRLLALVLLAAPLACGGPPAKVPRPLPPIPAATEVSDAAFASAVRDLLDADPGTKDRAARLSGVVSRQMARAAARFAAGSSERGLAAVQGALTLVRVGEIAPGLFGPKGAGALAASAREYASRGEEGRARAAYELLLFAGADAAASQDAHEHLAALAAWSQSQTGKPMLTAASAQREASARRMLEPSDAALRDADEGVAKWLQAAVDLRAKYRVRRGDLSPEEALEARRALEAGGLTLVALHLRDADAKGALAAVDRAQARALLREDTARALERADARPEASAWIEVLRSIAPGEPGTEDEIPVDRDVLRVAAFAVAAEAYRLDATQVDSAFVVADGLQAFGMAEASPAVLAFAVGAHPEPRVVGAALGVTLRAMAAEAEAQDAEAARRAYVAAEPMLKAASAMTGVLPSAARVRATMGEIELREGRLAQAKQLLADSARSEAAGAVLLALARIERHQSDSKAALSHLQQALQASDTAKDPALRGEVLLMTSDVVRESGDLPAARTPLTEALKELSTARNAPAPDDRARIERVLGQVLVRFGADKPAQRAFERALDAAPRDKVQASATLGLAIARAFVKGDLPTAREALGRSMSSELDESDLVYHALWVRLLERQLRAKTSGAADRVFAGIADDGRWPGKLAAFGAGRLKADDLVRAAKTDVQRTEALFYAAMDRRASGDAKGSDEALRQVMSGPGVDLIETQMARDLLGAASAQLGPVPPNLPIP